MLFSYIFIWSFQIRIYELLVEANLDMQISQEYFQDWIRM